MNQRIKIFIMSMKSSPRLHNLTKRLKKLKLKYKIFYGLPGKSKAEINKVYSVYDKQKVISRTGREMGFNEIGSGYTTLRVFKYCIKKNLKNVIIMNDDFYPSGLFKEWIYKNPFFKGNTIIGFCCFPPGLLKKKYKKTLDGKVKLYKSKTHLFNSGCSQVTIGFIKKYLKITKSKVIGNCDYPFNFKKNNMTMLQTIPFLSYPDDKGFSFLAKDREKLEKTFLRNFKKHLYKIFGIEFINKVFNFFRFPYYILFIPFILRKYKDYDYYIEYYFEKYFYKLINPIFKQYIDIENIYFLKSSYPKDLKKYAHHRV
jgi:hypothetical protein